MASCASESEAQHGLYPANGESVELAAAMSLKGLDAIHLSTLLAAYELVEMRTIEGQGRGLFATRDIVPDEILVSEAAFAWESSDGVHTPTLTVEQCTFRMLQMAPFHLNPADSAAPAAMAHNGVTSLTRLEIAREAMKANSFDVAVYSRHNEADAGAVVPDAGTSDSTGNTVAAPREVVVDDRTRDGSRALFSVICLTNHACGPNAKVYQLEGTGIASVEDAPVYVMQAREHIAAGAQITVSYVPRIWRKAQRQLTLTSVWGFTCSCPRCSTTTDDTIVARCPKCGDGRVYWGEHLQCEDCKCALSGTEMVAMPSGQSLPLSAIVDDDAMLDVVFQADATGASPPLSTLVARIQSHPLLAYEDSRMWAAMNQVLAQIDSDTDAELYEKLVMMIARTSLRTPYVNPSDLGIEVCVE